MRVTPRPFTSSDPEHVLQQLLGRKVGVLQHSANFATPTTKLFQ
jgi:hypothetical protein